VKRRQAWFDGQLDLDPERLVFIDGSKDGPRPTWRGGMADALAANG
jgi:hypothetical protein